MLRSQLTIRFGTVLAAAAAIAALGAPADAKRKNCDRNYKGACLKPNASDYDCAGGGGDGPFYVKRTVRIVGVDHYDLDADGDGLGCEPY